MKRYPVAKLTTYYASSLLFRAANREESSLNIMDGLAVTVGYQYSSKAIIDDSDNPHRMDSVELNRRHWNASATLLEHMMGKKFQCLIY